jgi:hypothetical protein
MKRILTVAVAAALLLPTVAFAVSGTITATANVLTPLSVTSNLRDLNFGDVFPGLNKSVAWSDATSGQWRIDGEAGKEVQMAFTLPANLNSGPNSMPISFAATDAAWNTTNSTAGAATFDPASGATELLDGGTGQLFVFLGGTVSPAPTQAAGVYTGTVLLDVVYTGN